MVQCYLDKYNATTTFIWLLCSAIWLPSSFGRKAAAPGTASPAPAAAPVTSADVCLPSCSNLRSFSQGSPQKYATKIAEHIQISYFLFLIAKYKMKIKQAALTATYTLYTIYIVYTHIYGIYSFIFIEECRENMAQIKCQQAEMKLQLVGHADDAKSRRVDAERGRGNPFQQPPPTALAGLLARLVYWKFAFYPRCFHCVAFFGNYTRISISISAWLLFCAFAYAIKFGEGSNSYGYKARSEARKGFPSPAPYLTMSIPAHLGPS